MSIVIVGARETAASFRAGMVEVEGQLRAAMSDYGQTLTEAIQGHASGRPGPNVITDVYRSSWGYVVSGSGGSVSVEVGTDAPQGYRLELGYHGTDSRGRSYNQPPFGHVDVSVEETSDVLALALTLMVGAQ